MGGWFLLLAGSTYAAFLLWRRDPQVLEEHQLVESTQTAVLLTACAVHGVRGWRAAGSVETVARLGLAMICLSFAVRETDIDRLSESPVWPVTELVARGIVVVIWIALGVWALRRAGELLAGWRTALGPAAWCAAAGGALYVASFALDKRMLPLTAETSLFVEEAVQLNACLLLLAAGTVPMLRRAARARLG
ncbi:MAG: hypothetical protein WD009_05055 [Phycisphaeraceae bacterium]